jgi:hypothetical protein
MKLIEYSWKINKVIKRDTQNPDHMKLEQFCSEFSKNIEMKGFTPANGFYEESYGDSNISMFANGLSDAPGLGAIISYFPEDDSFMIKFQDTISQSTGWSDIEFMGDIYGDSFRDIKRDIQKEIKKYEEKVFSNIDSDEYN